MPDLLKMYSTLRLGKLTPELIGSVVSWSQSRSLRRGEYKNLQPVKN